MVTVMFGKTGVYQDLISEFEVKSIHWQELTEDYETQFHCVAFPFLHKTLSQLKQQGYLLGVISNGLGQFQNRAIDGLLWLLIYLHRQSNGSSPKQRLAYLSPYCKGSEK